jgi:hypothetical protein
VTLDQTRFVAAPLTKTADTPTTSYCPVDAQGSVRAISDDTGAIVIADKPGWREAHPVADELPDRTPRVAKIRGRKWLIDPVPSVPTIHAAAAKSPSCRCSSAAECPSSDPCLIARDSC